MKWQLHCTYFWMKCYTVDFVLNKDGKLALINNDRRFQCLKISEYAPVCMSKCISILINITPPAVQNIFPIYGSANADNCDITTLFNKVVDDPPPWIHCIKKLNGFLMMTHSSNVMAVLVAMLRTYWVWFGRNINYYINYVPASSFLWPILQRLRGQGLPRCCFLTGSATNKLGSMLIITLDPDVISSHGIMWD